MSNFYRTIITVEILTEYPYNPEELSDVAYDILNGDASGEWKVTQQELIDGPTAAKALLEQGSDPSFFQLDADGNSLNDIDQEEE